LEAKKPRLEAKGKLAGETETHGARNRNLSCLEDVVGIVRKEKGKKGKEENLMLQCEKPPGRWE
jgi:hypothetical protein